MIRRTVNAGLRFRVLAAVAAIAVIGVGLTQLGNAPRDVYPEFEPPTVEIQTEALGLSAAEVEQLITAPLEADLLNGVAWVDDIRSESVLGLSSITMVFDPGTDLFRARQAVQERLAQAHALPNVSKPPQMLQPKSSTSRAMMIGLTSSNLSLIELSQLARWTIKPRLQGVEGVANVTSFGQRERQLQVQVDPARLAENQVPLQSVIESTGNSLWVSPLTFLEASSPGTGGFIESQNQRFTVRHVNPILSAGDLAKVAIVDKPGLTLGDVATVVEDHQPLIGDAQIDGRPGVMLVVEKLRGANTVDVTEGVEAALAQLAPALRDVTVDTGIYRPADYIRDSSANLGWAMLGALLLLVALLAFAFYQWRSALIATVAILTSMLGAALVLVARGETLNSMVLAGLAIALAAVVDDAIAGTDRIVRRLRDARSAGEAQNTGSVVVDAVVELRGALGYATAFLIVPVLPLFFMDGLLGYFGRPLAISYITALLVAMVTALLVTPALAVALFRTPAQARTESAFSRRLGGRYEGLLARLLAAPRRLLIGAAALAILGAVAIPAVGSSELPALRERDYLIELETKPGTSLPEMNRITAETGATLAALPGVREVSSHTGRAIGGDQVVNVNQAEMWVALDANADDGATVAAMKDLVARLNPVVDADVLTYQQYALKEVDESAEGPIVVRVYGHNEAVLAEKATELGARLDNVDGVENLLVELPVSQPTLEVEVNLERAAEYGVKPGDVRRTAATLLAGIEVGALYYDQKVFEVVVWGTPEVRQDTADVENLLIETPNRGLVPLTTLAEVRAAASPNVIEREGAFRRIDITASVAGRDRGDVAGEIREVIAGTSFPLEYRAELLGGYVEQQADDTRLLVLGGFALVAMMLLLQACFGSWKLGALIFLALPMALSGGLLAAWADGGGISVGASAGLLAVLGIAARHGIVFVRRCQHLRRREGMDFGTDLVAVAARERLIPTVMTTLAVALVFLPFVVTGDSAGQEILAPMGTVVLAGLVTTLLMSLLVVPALYLLVGGSLTETELDVLLFEDEQRGAAEGATPAATPRPAWAPGVVTP